MADQADRLADLTGGDDAAALSAPDPDPADAEPASRADEPRERPVTVRPARPAASPSSSRGVVPIEKATDLGSVQVLKHGNLYLLTDPFGDIHPDSRGLGLYHGDTRLLSCSVLRVGGARPVLLQALDGRQLPRRDPAHEPDASTATRTTRSSPTTAVAGRKLGHLAATG